MSSLNWQVESFRFTFINTEEGNPHKDFKWSSITSSEPETVTSKPSLGLHAEVGPWMGVNLTVSKQPGRTDIVLSVPEVEIGLEGMPSFDDFLNSALELVQGFEGLTSHRLAFGGVLVLPVGSAKSGYELLQSFLPFVKFEEDMSDFFLQINRKKNIGEYHVNELTKWSCSAYRRLVVSNDKVGQVESDFHAVRIEFDINNVDSNVAISGGDIVARIRDFAVRAKRITLEGAR
jgi:hypothetical protein